MTRSGPLRLSDLGNLSGKKVLVRADFNVPVKDGKVVDDIRIRKFLPTLEYLRSQKARIIIVSHIEGESNSLKPIFEHLRALLPGVPISFCEDCIENPDSISAIKDGEVVLCENLRLYQGEKANDETFARELAAFGEVFVNDAFSVSHRKHASVVSVPNYLPSAMGLLFEQELTHLSECLNPPHPFLFILGGAKFDTKVPLIRKFLDSADSVFVGGALAHNFFKANGWPIGNSLISTGDFGEAELVKNPKLFLPSDVVVSGEGEIRTVPADSIKSGEKIVDAGPETVATLGKHIAESAFILWNGPLGNYENGFTEPTLELAKLISESKARTVVGGGDTLAAIAMLGIENKFSFVSMAGGAMLDFLEAGTLPGIEALKKSAKKQK